MDWSDTLIVLGDSWFSSKQLLGWPRLVAYGGRALNESRVPHQFSTAELVWDTAFSQTSNAVCVRPGVRLREISSVGRKGNSPDHQLRSLNIC